MVFREKIIYLQMNGDNIIQLFIVTLETMFLLDNTSVLISYAYV